LAGIGACRGLRCGDGSLQARNLGLPFALRRIEPGRRSRFGFRTRCRGRLGERLLLGSRGGGAIGLMLCCCRSEIRLGRLDRGAARGFGISDGPVVRRDHGGAFGLERPSGC
jgi:hypothetical protein